MNNGPDPLETIDEQAARWLAALDSERVDREAFERWRSETPAHALAFIRAVSTWSSLDRLGRRRAIHQASPQLPAAGEDREEERLSDPGRRRMLTAAGVGGLLAAAGAGTFLTAQSSAHVIETAVGERQRVFAACGACLDVNTASRVRWWGSADHLDVELERGEVQIAMPAGPGRCTLHAASARLALEPGRFNARLLGRGQLQLVSLAGRARLIPSDGARWPALLPSGQALTMSPTSDESHPLSDEQIRQITAWRDGELLFTGQPLGIAVQEYNRYLTRPIRLADPKLAELRLGGRFDASDPSGFLRALQVNFGVRVDARQDHILLSR